MSKDCGSGEAWAIVNRAGVFISHTSSGSGGGSTNDVSGEGRMLSTSSIIRSYAVGSIFGGTGEPPSRAVVVIVVVLLKQEKCHIRVLGKIRMRSSGISW